MKIVVAGRNEEKAKMFAESFKSKIYLSFHENQASEVSLGQKDIKTGNTMKNNGKSDTIWKS